MLNIPMFIPGLRKSDNEGDTGGQHAGQLYGGGAGGNRGWTLPCSTSFHRAKTSAQARSPVSRGVPRSTARVDLRDSDSVVEQGCL